MKKEKISQTILNDFYKILIIIKKIPKFLASYAFIAILFLILVDVALGFYIYYFYIQNYNSNYTQANNSQIIMFNSQDYNWVLDKWSKKEKLFNDNYSGFVDPF